MSGSSQWKTKTRLWVHVEGAHWSKTSSDGPNLSAQALELLKMSYSQKEALCSTKAG